MGWRDSRNPVGDFNTQGQEKCQHCGAYYPEGTTTHPDNCHSNPANQEDE